MAAKNSTSSPRRNVLNDVIDKEARDKAFRLNPLVSSFSPGDTLETCAAVVGELGQLISIANGRDPDCDLGNVFYLFDAVKAAMMFELNAGQMEAA